MAETYRKAKVENYIERLRKRKAMLKSQIQQTELGELKPFLQGQITALDEVILEMETEFEIGESGGE